MSLRGFYDDNYTLASSHEQDSFGLSVSPTVGINIPLDQTLITADYIYTMYYYEDRSDDPVDQTHQFVFNLTHSFSERYMVEVKDSFVVAQEPGLIDPNHSQSSRANGDNIRNKASLRFKADITREVGVVVGYENVYYDYEQDGGNGVAPYNNPSLSGSLDRMEQTANVDLRWLMARSTTGIVGYQFRDVSYTQNEPIGFGSGGVGKIVSEDRNSRSHFGYVGADHAFNQTLQGSLRAGVQYTDYYNDPYDRDPEVSPYVEGSLSYAYTAGGSAQLGFRNARTQTDVVQNTAVADKFVLDEDTFVVFANVNHQITPKLNGNLFGSLQASTLNGGNYDGDTDMYYDVGVTLTYSINQHLSADVSYEFNILDSDISGRDYTRNRIFLGVTAAY